MTSTKSKKINANDAWESLISRYDIINEVSKKGTYHIKASAIKEVKEPRLMAKWDSTEQLPSVFKKHKLNILPNSRSSYILGDFKLYQEIPQLTENVTQMPFVNLPEFQTIDVDNITSENTAINVLILSGILEDFLDDGEYSQTFNGRMGTGKFNFNVNNHRKTTTSIEVTNAQCEIDGGFESENSVVILEAKNVVYEDFHIRQLYYPYRLWSEKVSKPIRLVFSVYSNKIFRLFEYKFLDKQDYSSIVLIKNKNYSLQDTSISFQDLVGVFETTEIEFNDTYNHNSKEVPFIQADNFERVISLLENMYENPMTDEEIAELMHFGSNIDNNNNISYRQSQYYYNAGRFLGLFEKSKDDGKIVSKLSKLGREIYSENYKRRQLALVSLMFKHRIFKELFALIIKTGDLPDLLKIEETMRSLRVCGESQIKRRAQSVKSWLSWIINLVDL